MCQLAHGFAGMEDNEKLIIKVGREPNIGIVSSYNEMLQHTPHIKHSLTL
jgi:phosphogluconate dehydratase